ncbi:MAG: hypothetical protein N2203_08165, partial [Bacteroidia bacterium]|nr:hypothetical protein [Bacteroidia bacterium]
MKSNLLDTILKDYVSNLDIERKVVFVLPSKRSVYYVKKALKDICNQNNIRLVFPSIITINELIENISNLVVLSKTDLIYYLYESYKEIFKQDAEEYHSFVKWGNMLLNDFNDIVISYPNNEEKQKQIFTNLKDIKEIEHWSLNREPLSDNQKKYLELMNKFYEIFCHFNNVLLRRGYAYTGLNYQEAVKVIQNNASSFVNRTDLFLFVGLNAITTPERMILEYLKKENKALFYWDYDTYYTNNELHEAGKFLRENFKVFEFKSSSPTQSYFDNKKEVHIVSANNDIEEVLFIKQKLSELQNELQTNALDDT